MAIGLKARVKINANIGNSPSRPTLDEEVAKLRLAEQLGRRHRHGPLDRASDIDEMREAIIAASAVPIGTVPIYQAMEQVERHRGADAGDLLDVIEHQARQGVDYMTIHAGVLLEHLPLCQHRVTGIVSRGGGSLARWMVHHRRENPLYERFDEMLEICAALRRDDLARRRAAARLDRRCLRRRAVRRARHARRADARAWERDVQVMIEGPGHVPITRSR